MEVFGDVVSHTNTTTTTAGRRHVLREPSKLEESFLSHLQHCLEAFHGRFDNLPVNIRTDLALSLVEASRFPGMQWKRFIVDQAEAAARGLDNWYLNSRVACSRSLLSRISQNDTGGTALLASEQNHSLGSVDQREHAQLGFEKIESSLNAIQKEDLSKAKSVLQSWTAYDQQCLSSLEEVVLFRHAILLGRIFRYQGEFETSPRYINQAFEILERRKDLTFNDDLRDLACDRADTLRELGLPHLAETDLRAALEMQPPHLTSSGGGSLLDLSLAEALFAQERFDEAERLCHEIGSRPRLLRFEKLRLHITLAKIYHVRRDWDRAFTFWSQALVASQAFTMTNGHTTRMILRSMCSVLHALGNKRLLEDTQQQMKILQDTARPGGILYWVAGLRCWWDDLLSKEYGRLDSEGGGIPLNK